MAKSLGKSEIDDQSFEFYKKKGAENAVADTMKSCVEAAKLETTETAVNSAMKACAGNVAKEALQNSLGSKNVTNADVNKFVQQAGKSSAADSRKNCMKAAGADMNEQIKCTRDRSELIDNIKAATGSPTVTLSAAEAYVLEGASGRAGESTVACTSLAGNDAAALQKCRSESQQHIATLLGKTFSSNKQNRRLITLSRHLVAASNAITSHEIEEVKLDCAASHVMDVSKACYDSAGSNRTKEQLCFSFNSDTRATLTEALGRSNISSTDVHQFNRMAQLKALASVNEALSADKLTSNSQKVCNEDAV